MAAAAMTVWSGGAGGEGHLSPSSGEAGAGWEQARGRGRNRVASRAGGAARHDGAASRAGSCGGARVRARLGAIAHPCAGARSARRVATLGDNGEELLDEGGFLRRERGRAVQVGLELLDASRAERFERRRGVGGLGLGHVAQELAEALRGSSGGDRAAHEGRRDGLEGGLELADDGG